MHCIEMKGSLKLLRAALCIVSLLCFSVMTAFGQTELSKEKLKKASRTLEKGYAKNNRDTLSQGYYDLGEA